MSIYQLKTLQISTPKTS